VEYTDRNPFWYKFTAFKAGTLGFLIEPLDQNDDYDWQLYDITGRNPDDVFTDASLIVTGNWSGTYGNTGASAGGVNSIQCASDPAQNKNSFSTMPQLKEGHTYLLLVSHFTNSQSGYNLSFNGGSAVITDPTVPALKTAEASCSGDVVRLKLTKRIKCASIASDGSDFYVTPSGMNTTAAVGVDCTIGFDSDSVSIKLNSSLPPGDYKLNVKKGSDGNTLLDNCDNPVAEADFVSFKVLLLAPTPMDSMVPVKCAPKELRLVFKKPIMCSSIATDGSDFSITGTYPQGIAAASGSCVAGATKEIVIVLTQPLQTAGNFNLVLKAGSDGNTLLDECAQQTPAGSAIAFGVKDTVNADFTYNIRYGCERDTVDYFHAGGNEVNSWRWNLDENGSSVQQNPQAIYSVFNKKLAELVVTNGFCSDTARQEVLLDNYLKADFSVLPDNCPMEPIAFTSTAVGKITTHHWNFGNGNVSSEMSPQNIYLQPDRETSFLVNYSVVDEWGCEQTATKPIKIYSSCTVFIPNAFTPDNDGRNDAFRVLNAVKAENFELRIFNRWGQMLFQSKDWKKGWDGRLNGQLQPTGTYVWFVRYKDSRNNQLVERKGSVVLIR
jgi:gliding motility-associated-like protein